jgi:lipopolysaccharide/colanic/teichoic acid biosynthesis glycosyltransferase
MRAENRSLTSSFEGIDRPDPASSGRAHRFDDRHASTSVRPASATPAPADSRWSDTLPFNDFLKDLHREKCRAERSREALSLALFKIDTHKTQHTRQADQLLEIIHGTKRETDILGHVGDDTIAVLCPDTDDHGVQSFLSHIAEKAGELHYETIAATYPDTLFETLAKGRDTRPPFHFFLAAEATSRRNGGYPLKRSLDLMGALVAIALLGPLMLLVGATIALSSPGPVIFRQTRLGRGGQPFTFYKFRSMAINVDDQIHRAFVTRLIRPEPPEDSAADGTPAPYKLQRDPRVTRLGRLMRKTSIDELPQLFNVIKGDMSLVGPRPALPYEAVLYQPWHLRRMLTMRPGITGLWQVDGRSRVSFNEMVRMDLRYIRDCSLALDLKILLKTVRVVLLCKGAV